MTSPVKANSKNGDPLALQQEALLLLERSYKVGEEGIGALDGQNLTEEAENIASAAASWRAWRFLQIHTTQLLSELYNAAGNIQESETNKLRTHEKAEDVRGGADAESLKVNCFSRLLTSEGCCALRNKRFPRYL